MIRSAALTPRIIAQRITACRAAREAASNAEPGAEHMETLRIRHTRSAVTPRIMAQRIAACRAAQLALEQR
jgi:hypothetical protein